MNPKDSTMSNRFAPRAISLAMAATITWSMLAGIDTLAYSRHAAHELMAQAAGWAAALA
jgi:hypothetical protein